MLHCLPAVWFASPCGVVLDHLVRVVPLLKRFHCQWQWDFYCCAIVLWFPLYLVISVTFRCHLPRCLNFSCSHALHGPWRSRLWWQLHCSDILGWLRVVSCCRRHRSSGIPLPLLPCSMLGVVTLQCSCGDHVVVYLCVARELLLFGCLSCFFHSIIMRNRTKDQGERGMRAWFFQEFWMRVRQFLPRIFDIIGRDRWQHPMHGCLVPDHVWQLLTAISLLFWISWKRWSLMAIGYQKGL